MSRNEYFSDRRRAQLARRVSALEILETRQMLAHGAAHVVNLDTAAPLVARPDLDPWAWKLATHPDGAKSEGLGDLANALRTHPAFARAHGLGTLLAHELAQHPYYAAAHGLTHMIAPPLSIVAGSGSPITNHDSSSTAPSSSSPATKAP